jgi:AcrR family transcriptional regulator
MVVTPWGESESLRDRMLRPGPGTSAAEVADNQRERLFGAMVASVSERGYEATRVADLVELSGVSSRSFYDLFPNKEACFAAALETLLRAAVSSLSKPEDPAQDWEDRLRDIYDAFTRMVASQPAAAKMCLIESYAAGPAAREPLERATKSFEDLTRRGLSESPERAGMSDDLICAHVGALQEIGRTRLREGDPASLAGLVPDLTRLTASYLPPPEPLRLATRPPAFERESVVAHDDAERVLRAFAVVLAERGYSGVTIHEVAKRGAMSPSTFYANFRDKEDALLAAIDSVSAQTATAAMTAFHRRPEWPTSVRAAIGSMLNFLASRPAMAQLLGAEVYAAGAKAIERRARALRPLVALLAEGYNSAPGVPPLATELIAGGIGALVHRRLRESGPGSLPALAPVCTYIALSPFIGADAACAAANSDGRGRAAGSPEPPESQPRVAVKPTKWSVITSLTTRNASVETLSSDLDVPAAVIARDMEELEEEGLIEPLAPEGPEGTIPWRLRAHFRLLDHEDWNRLSQEEREALNASTVRLVEREMNEAVERHTFASRLDNHLSRLGFTVDEQGWAELGEIHRAALHAARGVQLESLERLKESGEEGITGRSVQALFELPDP